MKTIDIILITVISLILLPFILLFIKIVLIGIATILGVMYLGGLIFHIIDKKLVFNPFKNIKHFYKLLYYRYLDYIYREECEVADQSQACVVHKTCGECEYLNGLRCIFYDIIIDPNDYSNLKRDIDNRIKQMNIINNKY